VAHSVSRAFKYAHLRRAMSFGKLSSISRWNTFVVVTMQQQQRAWSKALSGWHWPEPAQFASPFIEVFRKLRSLH
jgi:hypothetical protein